MKKLLLIGFAAFLFISASVVTTIQIVQPSVPKDVKILHIDHYTSEESIQSVLNTYKNIGYVIKSHSIILYNGYGTIHHFFILEKY